MAKISKTACDWCKVEVDNEHHEMNWIILRNFNILVTGAMQVQAHREDQLSKEFCGAACMHKWVKSLLHQRVEPETINADLSTWG